MAVPDEERGLTADVVNLSGGTIGQVEAEHVQSVIQR